MEWTITLLGRVAGKSKIAFSFVQKATSEDYWVRNRPRKLTDPKHEEYANILCQKAAIRAIGWSGRPETISILDGLRTMYPLGSSKLREIASCIEKAYWEGDRVKEKGFASFRDGFVSMNDYEAWKMTPHGREVSKWYQRTQLSEASIKLLLEHDREKTSFEQKLRTAKTALSISQIQSEMSAAQERFLAKWREFEDAEWKKWINQSTTSSTESRTTTNQVAPGKTEVDLRAKKLEEDRLKIWREYDLEMSALRLRLFDAKTSDEREKIFAEISASKNRYSSNWQALSEAEIKGWTWENAIKGMPLTNHSPSFYRQLLNAVNSINASRHRPPPE